MEIHILPSLLSHHINLVQRAISNRSNQLIFQCIQFEAKEQTLYLTATDQELVIRTKLDCQVLEEGVFVAPATLIGNIFRKFPDSIAKISCQEQLLDIQCLQSHFQLQVPSPQEFPLLPQLDFEDIVYLESETFKEAIEQTEFAVAQDDKYIVLTGIFVKRQGNEMHLVSLDGYRVAIKSLQVQHEGMEENHEMIVPKRALSELSKILQTEETIKMISSKSLVLFETENLQLYSRLIDKTYLDYEEIINEEYTTEVKVDKYLFQQAMDRVSLLSKEEKANLIKMYIRGDKMYLTSNTSIGHVKEEIAIERKGEDLTIAFNVRYLFEGVRAIREENVSLYFRGALNPLSIRPEMKKDYLYIALPVRVAKEG